MSPRTSLHPIQLVEIRADAVHVLRRARRPGESDARPRAYVPRARLIARSEDETTFTIVVRARVRVPLPDDEIWSASVSLRAKFVRDQPVAAELAQTFARLSGLFIVWPYARLYLSELAQMAGVPTTPLPLLTRPRGAALPPVVSEP